MSSTLASFQRRNVNVMGKLGMENCSPAIWQQVFMIRLPPIVQDGNFWAVVADSTTEGWWKFLKNSASGSSF